MIRTFEVFRSFLTPVAALSICVAVVAGVRPVEASPDPALPFEPYFAKTRGGGPALRFNDFSGRISEARIKALLRSGTILGDKVLLQNGTAVYFPEGYIVSASTSLQQFRPKNGKRAKAVRSPDDLERNPDYGLIDRFDGLLGPVCAEGPGASPGTMVRVRQSERGVLSVVIIGPGRFDALLGEKTVGYRVTSALNAAYLEIDAMTESLIGDCLSP